MSEKRPPSSAEQAVATPEQLISVLQLAGKLIAESGDTHLVTNGLIPGLTSYESMAGKAALTCLSEFEDWDDCHVSYYPPETDVRVQAEVSFDFEKEFLFPDVVFPERPRTQEKVISIFQDGSVFIDVIDYDPLQMLAAMQEIASMDQDERTQAIQESVELANMARKIQEDHDAGQGVDLGEDVLTVQQVDQLSLLTRAAFTA